jgi:general secretion pathway protein D
VPFVTGQYLSANTPVTSGTVSPFQTIERKDVGLTLRIKPQISENGTVKLAIFQEVSSVDPASVGASTGLVTNKRSIESNVLVDDGSVVVLGGLLSDEYSDTVDKVPGLGDVPVLGNLFKTESRTRSKTNLMVFLRPLVVRDAAAAETLSLDRYELMRSTQQMVQPVPNAVLGQDSGPQLAPAPAKAPSGTTPAAIVVPSIPVRPVPAWPPTGGSPAPVDPNASSARVAP